MVIGIAGVISEAINKCGSRCGMGLKMGTTASLDERGRVMIPKELRERLGLKPEQSLLIEIRGEEIVLRRAVDLNTFVRELRGCIKGSVVEPLRLKEIWGAQHAHH